MRRLSLGSLARLRVYKESFVAAVLVVFVSYGLAPLWKTGRGLDLQIMRMDERLRQIRQYLYYAKNNKIPAPVAQQALQQEQAPQALTRIQKIAADTGVVVASIRVNARQMELSVQGLEKNCFEFIRKLKEPGSLCRIQHLNLKADPRQEAGLLVRLQLAKIGLLAEPDADATVSFDGPAAPAAVSPQRDLFKAPSKAQHKNVVVAQGREENPIADLSLVGIVEDGAKKAVIEDKKSGKTYFLKPGDMMGRLKVAAIKDQEVVLEIEGVPCSLLM